MPKTITEKGIPLSRITEEVNGELIGNPKIKVYSICPVDKPEDGCLCFWQKKSLTQLKKCLLEPRIKALISNTGLDRQDMPQDSNLIVVKDPLAAIIKIIPLFFHSHPPPEGISSKADIHPAASVAESAKIGAFVSIGAEAIIEEEVTIYPHVTVYPGARIGSGSIIHAGSVIREDCRIGSSCIVQPSAVIGSDGFGYIPDGNGSLTAVPQVGSVSIGNQVDIGAGSCIDKGTIGTTVVSQGTKIDNLVQIGHNTKIGKSSILCGQVGIAGSCKIGNGVVLGGNVGIADHLHIADGCRLAAKSGVTSSLKEKGDYAGFPAIPISAWRKSIALLRNLPKLMKQLKAHIDDH